MFVFRRCESHFAVSFANDRAYRRLSIQIQGPAFRDCFCALWHETLFHFALFKKSCFVKCVVCFLTFYTLVLVFYKFLEVHLHFALNVRSDVDDNVVVAISHEHWDCSDVDDNVVVAVSEEHWDCLRHFATRSLLVAFVFSLSVRNSDTFLSVPRVFWSCLMHAPAT